MHSGEKEARGIYKFEIRTHILNILGLPACLFIDLANSNFWELQDGLFLHFLQSTLQFRLF